MNVKQTDERIRKILKEAFERGEDGFLLDRFFADNGMPLSVSFSVQGELCSMSDSGSAVAHLKARVGDLWLNYASHVVKDKGIVLQLEGESVTGQFSFIDGIGLCYRFGIFLQYLMHIAYADMLFSSVPDIADIELEDALLPLQKGCSDTVKEAFLSGAYVTEKFGKRYFYPRVRYIKNEGAAYCTLSEKGGRIRIADAVTGFEDGSVFECYLSYNDGVSERQRDILKAFGGALEGESTVLYAEREAELPRALINYVQMASVASAYGEY